MKEQAKTEKEMCEAKAPWPKTMKELTEYINSLTEREHDYGTCVYAMSLAAVATFNYIGAKLGTTGFQAGCADMDILNRTRNMTCGFRIINYENLLYPQYLNSDHFPTPTQILMENKAHLAEEARKRLAERGPFHPEVKARLEYVASLDKPKIKKNAKKVA